MKKTKRIYLDYAAATPPCSVAAKAYSKASALYGNPSALHHEGVAAAESLAQSRAYVAALLEVKPSDIRFVSGGTEANNIALLGTVRALKKQFEKIHVITSAIEHASVLEPLRVAQQEWGVSVTYVQPNEDGIIKPQALRAALTEHTRLISIGIANNETGVLQPIKSLVQTTKKYGNQVTIFHTDAGQVHLHESALPHSLGVDMMGMGSGKLYGPRGIGALYVRRGTPVQPIMFGGGHEEGLRSGTESTALAAGFGAACAKIVEVRTKETKRMRTLQTFLAQELKKQGGIMNGEKSDRLPHIVNVSFKDVDPEYLVAYLDARGVALATKSACSQRAGEKASHVIAAMYSGEQSWRAYTALRISMGRSTTKADLVQLLALLPQALAASAIR